MPRGNFTKMDDGTPLSFIQEAIFEKRMNNGRNYSTPEHTNNTNNTNNINNTNNSISTPTILWSPGVNSPVQLSTISFTQVSAGYNHNLEVTDIFDFFT